MRLPIHASFGALAALLLAGSGFAQQPYMTYNQMRAYRHFLNSPYSYRTYSGLSPGYTLDMPAPYGEQQYYQGPSYVEQRITPWGFEGYQSLPPTGYRYLQYPRIYIMPANPIVVGAPAAWMP